MFWGLIMEPGKKYTQQVQQAFHISHAALDLNNAGNDPVQVLLGFDNRNYLVCTLQKGKWIQTPLDLNFQEGDKISFTTNGPGHVHLTGYLVPEDDFGMGGDEEGEEEESENEIDEKEIQKMMKKRKNEDKISSVAKKTKTAELLDAINSDDTDDSDDSDVNLTDILEDGGDEEEDGKEEEDEEGGEEEEDDEDDDSDDNDDFDEDDDSDEMEVDSDEAPKKQNQSPIKENGVAKVKTPKGDKTPGKDKNKTPNEKLKGDKTPQQKGDKTPGKEGQSPMKKTIEGGVIVEDIKVGDGPVAKPGKVLQVYYEGRLKSNNKQFDATKQGPGFKFRLGKQEVIKGWDVGFSGMKVGGKRRITCPPNMAYGAKGSPPVIPPNSTLVFEVELKNVKN